MDERYIAAENTYTQQNYFIQLCMGCTDHLSELKARYHKTQAEAWKNRARQLEAESQDLCSQVEALQDRIGWYRARYHELKEENRSLRARLAKYMPSWKRS